MKGFSNAVTAAKDAEHRGELQQLRRQLASERAAHAETLKALQGARRKRAGLHTATTPRIVKSHAQDLLEVTFADVHGNKHDPLAWHAFITDLKTINPHRIFIGGDLLDCGGFLAEHHALGYVADTEDSYQEDVDVANRLLDQVQAAAPRAAIHYLEGNHEHRVERWALTQRLAHHKDVEHLRKTWAAENVLHLAERGIRYYAQGKIHPGCHVPGWIKMDRLYYCHKISNAADAARMALSKAGGNVVFFDTHRADFYTTNRPGTGLISAWNPGCLCKRQPLYCNTNPTGWTHGYLLRLISKTTGRFQMMHTAIDEGVSYGGLMLRAVER